MIINPLIDILQACLEEGPNSTVSTSLLRKVIESMKLADNVINRTDEILTKIEKNNDR